MVQEVTVEKSIRKNIPNSMSSSGPDCVKTQSHANFRDALTIPGAKQIDCGAFDEVGLLWAIPVSSFLHSLGRNRPVGHQYNWPLSTIISGFIPCQEPDNHFHGLLLLHRVPR